MSRVEARMDGRTRRWDSHRTARRNELTHAARKAVHHGGADLSMDEIAAAIGTSKSIVYRYFNDRAGLQTAVGEAVLADLGAALAQASHGANSPQGAMRAMVRVYLEMISSSPAVYDFVTRGGDRGVDGSEPTAPMSTLANDAARLLEPALAQVLAHTGRPVHLASVWAAGVIGFVRGGAEIWLSDRAWAASTATPQVPSDLGALDGGLIDLADAITDWICFGTQAPPLTS